VSRHLHAVSAALAVATLVGASVARADDTSELEGLLDETVVTTASKSAETGSSAPATSTTLTAEDMRRYGIHSLDEAIDFLSLGVVTSNPLRSVHVGARGVLLPRDQGDHFLLLVNGHSVNEPLFGAARFERGAGIPMELIDHIEVILGPGSVLYGSNAMLGVINVITKRAKDWRGAHVVIESEIGKSYRAQGGAGYGFDLFGKKSEITLAVEYFRQDGPTFHFGPQQGGIDSVSGLPTRYTRNGPPTGIWGGDTPSSYYSAVPAGMLRFKSGNLEINVQAKTYKRSTPYRSRYEQPVLDFDDPNSYEIDRSLWVDVKHKATLSPIVQLTTRAYADTFDYRDYFVSSLASSCLYEAKTCRYVVTGASRWAGLELQSSFDWLRDNRLVTLLGVDARVRFTGSKGDVYDDDTGKALAASTSVLHRTDKTLGAYVQQTWQPARWLDLNGGARIDSEDRFRGVLSPRLAASARAWKGATLKGIFAEAFRSPSWFESAYFAADQILAKNLRPERVRSIEGSIEQRIGAQRLTLGAFRSWWTDLVELHTLSPQEEQAAAAAGEINLLRSNGIAQYRNVSTLDNYGVDASYDGALLDGTLRYGVNFTGAFARKIDPVLGDQPRVVAPEIFGNARVSYDLPGAWPTLAVAGHYVGRRPADRAFVGGFQPEPYAPAQVELRGTVSGAIPFVPGLSYRASANYAFADRGPYVVGPIQDTQSQQPGAPPLRPELVPVDTFRATLGLQYDFLP
jgi:outer membrane receptor for ferrienterochelin and colicins